MIFYKSVAGGNDFLHVNLDDFSHQSLGKGELARHMCHRHSGPGGDGVVYYRTGPAPHASPIGPAPRVSFQIFNCDGNEAELSGNGMAGLAALLFFQQQFQQQVTMETRVGIRTHRMLHQDENKFRLNIHIGPPEFNARSFFPFLDKGVHKYQFNGIDFYPVSVGNPHVVVLMDRDREDGELAHMGAMLEQADLFPHNTNVEFVLPGARSDGTVNYESGENFRVFFYERGVGRTLASSTGSAAVFAVLQKTGAVRQMLTLPSGSGELNPKPRKTIKITGKNDIFIENSVEIVYKGVYLKNHSR